MLEIVQPHHQPGGLGWGALVGAVAILERHVESLPIDLPRELDQRVFGVEQLIEVGLKELKGVTRPGLRRHRGSSNCKVWADPKDNPCNLTHPIHTENPVKTSLSSVIQGRRRSECDRREIAILFAPERYHRWRSRGVTIALSSPWASP